MKRFLTFIMLCFMPAACQGASEDGSERSYDGVFDGLIIPSRYVERIKLFDRMAFVGEHDRYVSAGLRKRTYGASKQPRYRAAVFYGGTLSAMPYFILGNAAVLRGSNFYPYLAEVREVSTADIIILGRETLLDMQTGPEGISPMEYLAASLGRGATVNRHVSDHGKCILFGAIENHVVLKTVAFLELDHTSEPSDEVQKAVIACINRAHYLHFGFSNVPNMDATSFVERGGVTKLFRMNTDFSSYFPIFFQDGSMAGKSRYEVLRAYAEQAGKAK